VLTLPTWFTLAFAGSRVHSRHQVPVVLEMHGPPEGKLGPLLFSLLLWLPEKKRILPITGALARILGEFSQDWRAALSQQEVSGLRTINIKPNLSFTVSPNGVDLERFHGLPEPAQARTGWACRRASPLATRVTSTPPRHVCWLNWRAFSPDKFPVGGRTRTSARRTRLS
jgi:hypothetical protein